MEGLLDRRIDLESYLIRSTVVAVFLFQNIAHVAVDIMLGYPIIVLNALILLSLDRLTIHRNHAILVGTLAALSITASTFSGTSTMSILAQIIGISGFSIYFFSAFTTLGVSITRWLEMYLEIAVLVAIYGIGDYFLRLAFFPGNENRLTSIYVEPSLFIYLTLPALGIYMHEWLRRRRYGTELLIFLVAYGLAESTLGFLGLFLVVFFALLPSLNFARFLAFGLAACASFVGLFFVSSSFRLRMLDTFLALANADLRGVNPTTFAALTNGYVTIRAFLDHPFLGVGIGGYQFAYTRYISGLSGLNSQFITLNMYDASSMFFRATAELGIFGLFCIVGFYGVFSRVKGERYLEIRNALLPYLIVRMTRLGAYFSVELYFFVGLFIFNYLESHTQGVKKPALAAQPPLPDVKPSPA